MMDLADLGLTDAAIARIMAHAASAPGIRRKTRSTQMDRVRRAIEAGQEPPPLEVPASNYWAQAHADKIREAALARDADTIRAMAFNGTNTYSRLLRQYRNACLAYATASS